MKASVFLALAGLLIAAPAHARAQQDSQTPSVTSQTTLVIVPALVRDKDGNPVFGLTADDFALTDDGVPEKLTLEPDAGSRPLALAVVVETGGAGAREFDNLGPLAPMLEAIVGNVPHEVAVISFDSQPELVEDFTWNLDRARDAVASLTAGCKRQHYLDPCKDKSVLHPSGGDNGAAILDSLNYAVFLLDMVPPAYRRVILLVSETVDRGSKTTIDEAVRDLSDSNTTIYSVGFSTAKSEAAHYAHRELPTQRVPGEGLTLTNPYPNPPHGCMGKETDPDPDLTNNKLAKLYDCAGQLAPPLALAKMAAIAARDSLQVNVPETVARLTGGAYFKLDGARSLEFDLQSIWNEIPNRYVLNYHPVAPHPGFHAIKLSLPELVDLELTARTSYWVNAARPDNR